MRFLALGTGCQQGLPRDKTKSFLPARGPKGSGLPLGLGDARG